MGLGVLLVTEQERQYSARMTAKELQAIFRELPAGAFTIHIIERTPIEVAHSDFAALKPDGGVLTVWDAEDHLHHIHAPSITRITHAVPSAPVGS